MKTALITGSSRGIGKAIAEEFAKNGYYVILNAFNNSEELDNTFDEFKNKGYMCEKVLVDISDYEACKKLFLKNIDVLVNNAGISYIGLLTDMNPEDWKRVIDVNLNSVINCTQLALKTMIKNHSGNIINISSIWGEQGASCESVYSATKGGINAFTKAIAKEVGPSSIRVNTISCGVIDTKMNANFQKDEIDELINGISLNRMGTVDEVAKLAYFIADDSKSGYINGQIITMDGGMY